MAGRIGWVECGYCDNIEAAVSETKTGILQVNCHRCEFSGYGRPGTKAARIIKANMRPDEENPKPAPASGSDKPTSKPAPAAKRPAFDMGEL